MDNDNFSPLKVRGSQILGLRKLAVKAIETEGIKLGETTAKEPNNRYLIGWFDALGTLRQFIWGQERNGFHTLHLESFLNGGLFNTSLELAGAPAKEEGFIQFKIGLQEKVLLSLPGLKSDFLQTLRPQKGIEPPELRQRVVFSGACSAAGAILQGSSLFTCSRTGVGRYTIKPTTALSSAASIYVELNGNFTQVYKSSGPSTTEWQLQINGFNFSIPALEAADEAFSFIVLQH